jgi:acetolactate synthase-1/2/3 large subunit
MNPDYAPIAQGYGIPYQAVTDRNDLAASVRKMLSTDGPFILECQIKEEDNVLPMTPPGMDVDKMMLEI